MKKLIPVIALMTLLIPSAVVIASDVSQADYVTQLVATNADTEAKTDVAAVLDLSTQGMISSGMLNSDADDAAMLATGAVDVPFMPGYDTNPWVFLVPSIPLSSSQNYYLYTGGVTGGEIRYFPGDAGMTVADNAMLELGNHFEIEFTDVYIDTSNSTIPKILYKGDDFQIAAGAYFGGFVVAGIGVQAYPADNMTPNAVGAYTTLTPSAGNNWDCVNDTPGTPNDADYVSNASGWLYDAYNVTSPAAFPGGAVIIGVGVFMRVGDTAISYDGSYRSGLKLGADVSYGAIHSDVLVGIGDIRNYTDAIARPGGGAWAEADFVNLEVIVGIDFPVGGSGRCYQIYPYVIYWVPSVSALLRDVPPAEYASLTVSANTTHLAIAIDGIDPGLLWSTPLGGVSVADGADDYIFFENDSVVYAGSASIDVSGVPVSQWEWEYDSTFYDSIGSNDATPTFRTISSDPDVTVSIYSQESTAEQGSPDVAETGGFTMIGEVPVEPSGIFSSGGTDFLGSEQIANLATATRIPYVSWCYVFAFGSAMLAGAGVYGATHRNKAGIKGSLLLMTLTMVVVLCVWIFGGDGVISGFVLIPFVLIMLFLLMIRNPQSPVVG